MMSGESESLPVTFGQEYRVKLGKSFTFPDRNAFHSLKYDFKPQSVDSKRPGRLKITGDGAVNVSLPVGQEESGEDYAQFRGPKKTCTKECILIIDRNTGEAILERISDTVQLKAIRDGRKLTVPRDRSVSPCPPSSQPPKPLNPKPVTKTASSLVPPTVSKTKSKKSKQGISASKNVPVPSKSESRSKVKSQTQRSSHNLATSLVAGSAGQNSSKHHKASHLSDILDVNPPTISPIRSANPTPEPSLPALKKAKIFHGSSSSSSSSSSSASSSSEDEDVVLKPTSQPHPIPPSSVSDSPATKTASMSTWSKSANESSSRSHHTPSSSSSSLHISQRSEATPISRTSSGTRLGSSQSAADQTAPSMPSLAHFLDPSSYQLLNKQSEPSQQKQVKQEQVTVKAAPPTHIPPTHSGHGGGFSQHRPPPPPRQKIDVMSSSSSDTDSSSSSGSTSSDEENDREVANVFRQAHEMPERQMSMSLLRSDLNLSESGSDSD